MALKELAGIAMLHAPYAHGLLADASPIVPRPNSLMILHSDHNNRAFVEELLLEKGNLLASKLGQNNTSSKLKD